MLAFSSTLLKGRLQAVVVSEKGRSGPSSYFIMLQLNVACKLKLGLQARLPPRDSGSPSDISHRGVGLDTRPPRAILELRLAICQAVHTKQLDETVKKIDRLPLHSLEKP